MARQQGSVDTSTIETKIKVSNPDDPEPLIKLYVENQADPVMQIVYEMMMLCGEVIATLGSLKKIPLHYRGQPQSSMDTSAFAHLPEGPVRSSAMVKLMGAAELDFRKVYTAWNFRTSGLCSIYISNMQIFGSPGILPGWTASFCLGTLGVHVGDEVKVHVEEACRDDILTLKEILTS